MKISASIFIVVFLAIGVVSATPLENKLNDPRLGDFIGDLINGTINKLISNISDPIAFESLPLNFSSAVLNGDAHFNKFELFGIKNLVATKIDVTLLSLALNATIKIPQIILNTKYDANMTILELVPLYGDGRAGVTLDDTEFYVSGKVSTKGGLSISNVTVSFNIGGGIFQFTGILNNNDLSALITEVCNDNIIQFIDEYQTAISKIISPIAGEIINALLGGSNESAELLEFLELYEAEVAERTM